MMRRSVSFSGLDHHHGQKCDEGGGGGDDDLSDDGSQLGEKKKRLNLEQVKALEKSFELGNKLDPERKLQLARALGLQPRQIAIWFQNRRARWKTKQLERDYEVLKKQFDALKADNETLQAQNEKLHGEVYWSINFLIKMLFSLNCMIRLWRSEGGHHGFFRISPSRKPPCTYNHQFSYLEQAYAQRPTLLYLHIFCFLRMTWF